MLSVLTAGSLAGAADVRLGLNSSLSLGCQVAGARAGLQEGRVGAFVQGAYCTSNIQGESGGAAIGGGLTVDFYQSPTLNAYVMAGANTVPNSGGAVFGGVGLRYGIPLFPVEAYVEGGVQRQSNIITGATIAPRLAVGVNYVVRGIDLNAGLGGASSPSNISSPGTGGLNVDRNGTGPATAGNGEPAPASCNLSPEADAAAARAAAQGAARSALSAAASAYSAVYSNVSYDLSLGSANINGGSATVSGTITLRGTNRANGQAVSGTYSGVVRLVRSGCGWQATGYTQSGGGE
ncbi:hypothetical protein ASF71_09445 [Deinococcus sp. Leaf326]|nr:hypothetical protein ASF71_09445 [Deinococcus sp. Leaf326]